MWVCMPLPAEPGQAKAGQEDLHDDADHEQDGRGGEQVAPDLHRVSLRLLRVRVVGPDSAGYPQCTQRGKVAGQAIGP